MPDKQEKKSAISTLTWKTGKPAPETMSSYRGSAVVHHGIAYFSKIFNVYSYGLLEDKWTKLQPCQQRDFSLAVIDDTLTVIGGSTSNRTCTNILLSLTRIGSDKKWKKILPPMPTERAFSASIVTANHLVIAGGKNDTEDLSSVDIMTIESHQWSMAIALPEAVRDPSITLCDGHLYLSNDNSLFSGSVERLLQTSMPYSRRAFSLSTRVPTTPKSNPSNKPVFEWNKLSDVNKSSSLCTFGGHVLAVGGIRDYKPSGAIHCYDRDTNSWHVIGEMPTARYDVLATVLPGNQLVVVGGQTKVLNLSSTTEIGQM